MNGQNAMSWIGPDGTERRERELRGVLGKGLAECTGYGAAFGEDQRDRRARDVEVRGLADERDGGAPMP